jgi:hypothetical protein
MITTDCDFHSRLQEIAVPDEVSCNTSLNRIWKLQEPDHCLERMDRGILHLLSRVPRRMRRAIEESLSICG